MGDSQWGVSVGHQNLSLPMMVNARFLSMNSPTKRRYPPPDAIIHSGLVNLEFGHWGRLRNNMDQQTNIQPEAQPESQSETREELAQQIVVNIRHLFEEASSDE